MAEPHDCQAYARSAGLDPDRLPRHIAIIMDGNGRWARQRGEPRSQGHAQGAVSVDRVVEECCRLGIEQLTLYCLSIENWKRPQHELDFLMALLKDYLIGQRPKIQAQNIRFRMIGRREGLPVDVLAELDESIQSSARNTGLTLCLAINYGGRTEILDACKALVRKTLDQGGNPDALTEDDFELCLYTAGMPDPDLLIRTAGEMRVSNYLLWQISYAEIWVTETYWPDFGPDSLHQALRDYSQRERRFGGLTEVAHPPG